MDTDSKQATATAEELRIEIDKYRSLCDTKDERINELKKQRNTLIAERNTYRQALLIELRLYIPVE